MLAIVAEANRRAIADEVRIGVFEVGKSLAINGVPQDGVDVILIAVRQAGSAGSSQQPFAVRTEDSVVNRRGILVAEDEQFLAGRGVQDAARLLGEDDSCAVRTEAGDAGALRHREHFSGRRIPQRNLGPLPGAEQAHAVGAELQRI